MLITYVLLTIYCVPETVLGISLLTFHIEGSVFLSLSWSWGNMLRKLTRVTWLERKLGNSGDLQGPPWVDDHFFPPPLLHRTEEMFMVFFCILIDSSYLLMSVKPSGRENSFSYCLFLDWTCEIAWLMFWSTRIVMVEPKLTPLHSYLLGSLPCGAEVP